MDVVNAFSMKSQLKPETRYHPGSRLNSSISSFRLFHHTYARYRRVFGASPPQIEQSGRLQF
ncbi:hypothetical protein BELL_0088g00100 [Botrytis elliptica]|uniref:Uncharacterized protein n=1 Tax=Botrytis elliptica TaxID=278938 RepID=A0A4Z1JWR8_9HELO|nr:hypothetical protein BELL_0088g00100 [Botrytis elliptica]